MSEAITIQESARLVELEDVIERGLSNFIKVGEALLEIRESRLYRTDYETFEDYCREEWQMSYWYATKTIASAAAIEDMLKKSGVEGSKNVDAFCAFMAYGIADAMLAEREKGAAK